MSRAIVIRLVVVLTGAIGIAPALASGATWTVLPTLNRLVAQGALAGVSCPSPTSCLAVGRSANARGILAPVAESWDGTNWATEPAPPGGFDSVLAGVSCSATTALWPAPTCWLVTSCPDGVSAP